VRVEKWYLDCVTAEGAGLIGYAARLSWGPLAVRCAETLAWTTDDQPAQSRTVLGGALPTLTSEAVRWQCPAVQARGRWTRLGSGMPAVILHEEAAGRIEWTCYCPFARAEVFVGTQRCEGFGYAERLVLTLPPARLPLRELCWGRFIAEGHSLVWIRWRGPLARSWVFHNGIPVEAALTAEDEITWEGHRLHLTAGHTLRTGRVINTVGQNAPWLRWLMPAVWRRVEETKWCSRGVLADAQGRPHSGWAIHEVALFP
jgi:hypothetical protein